MEQMQFRADARATNNNIQEIISLPSSALFNVILGISRFASAVRMLLLLLLDEMEYNFNCQELCGVVEETKTDTPLSSQADTLKALIMLLERELNFVRHLD